MIFTKQGILRPVIVPRYAQLPVFIINLTALNKLEDFIPAILEIEGDLITPRYLRQPFYREPDFSVTSVNYDFQDLILRSGAPQ